MARLKNFNGRYCESDYENAFLSFLEREGWQYLSGGGIPRASRREVLYTDELEQFLSNTNFYVSIISSEIPENASVFSVFATSELAFSLVFSLMGRNKGKFFYTAPTT